MSGFFFRIGVFVLAALASVLAGMWAAQTIENRSVLAVQEDLIDRNFEWASVVGDGLQIIIEGEAPTESTRFRAMSAAGRIVDASRVIDGMSVKESAGIAAPEFAIEILRNDSGVFLIGLIPDAMDRDALNNDLVDLADGLPVSDLLETADYQTPETWNRAVKFAVRALEDLPRSKISVSSDRIAIDAITDSREEQASLERQLTRNPPDGVELALNVRAPRPVVAPFTTRFSLNEDGAKLAACAVETEEAADLILSAARFLGYQPTETSCVLALGAPSREWGKAVALSIDAVGDLGGGTVTVSDTDITIVALQGTAEGLFDTTIGTLENALPTAFAVTAELPKAPDESSEGPPKFVATRSPEGTVQLRGRVTDEVANLVAENYAAARFGKENITMGTRVASNLPSRWSVRVLTGLEALSELSNGSVVVEPGTVVIRGNTGNPDASADITRLMIDKLGQAADVQIDVTYVKQLDPVAGLPTVEECIEQVQTLTSVRKILFEPSSATISVGTQGLMDDLAEILQKCPDLKMQIAGYTDSQGREVMNQQLSEDRARSVLDALRLRRIPTSNFVAIGFGEADPIADNGTEEGREANRRIEFSLIVPEPIEEEPTALEQMEASTDANDESE